MGVDPYGKEMFDIGDADEHGRGDQPEQQNPGDRGRGETRGNHGGSRIKVPVKLQR